MQGKAAAEDIHTILSRFSSWSGKQPQASLEAGEGVREIPWEEALRQLRERPKAQGCGSVAAHPAAAGQDPPDGAAKAERRSGAAAGFGPGGTGQGRTKKTRMAAHAKAKKPAPRPAATAGAESAPAFRQALARSLPQVRGSKPGSQDRELRVSVRLSRAEEQELQRRAAQAGITVSAYLRKRALDVESGAPAAAHAQPEAGVTEEGRRAGFWQEGASADEIFTPEPQSPEARAEESWLKRLRRRLLASPEFEASA